MIERLLALIRLAGVAAVAYGQYGLVGKDILNEDWKPVGVGAALILAGSLGSLRWIPKPFSPPTGRIPWKEWGWLALIILTGSLIHLEGAIQMETTFTEDEGNLARVTYFIMHNPSVPGYKYSQECLYHTNNCLDAYLGAAAFAITGRPTLLTQRVVNIFESQILVLMIFLFVRRLWGGRIALGAAALWNTTLYSHVFSLLSIGLLSATLLTVSVLYLLWRIFEGPRARLGVWLGVAVGLGIFAYTAFQPFTMGSLMVWPLLLLVRWRNWRGLLVCWGTFLVVLGGILWAGSLGDLSQAQSLLFNAKYDMLAINKVAVMGTPAEIAANLEKCVLQNFRPQFHEYFLSGAFAYWEPWITPFLVAGLGAVLLNLWRLPALATMVWMVAGFLPGVITNIARDYRLILGMVSLTVVAAIGIWEVLDMGRILLTIRVLEPWFSPARLQPVLFTVLLASHGALAYAGPFYDYWHLDALRRGERMATWDVLVVRPVAEAALKKMDQDNVAVISGKTRFYYGMELLTYWKTRDSGFFPLHRPHPVEVLPLPSATRPYSLFLDTWDDHDRPVRELVKELYPDAMLHFFPSLVPDSFGSIPWYQISKDHTERILGLTVRQEGRQAILGRLLRLDGTEKCPGENLSGGERLVANGYISFPWKGEFFLYCSPLPGLQIILDGQEIPFTPEPEGNRLRTRIRTEEGYVPVRINWSKQGEEIPRLWMKIFLDEDPKPLPPQRFFTPPAELKLFRGKVEIR